MKVVHIITGLDRGGAEGALVRLVCGDQANEHVVVSLANRGVHASTLEANRIPVHVIGLPRGQVTLRGVKKLFSILRAENPDLVQTWMYHSDLLGSLIARAAGIQTVVWGIRHSNMHATETSRSAAMSARACALLSGCVPSKIVSCSEQAERVHTAMGYEPTKFVVIPNGYDCRRFSPDPQIRAKVRAGLGLAADEVVVGMVARWHAQKDHPTLLRALKSPALQAFSTFKCLLVGPQVDTSNDALMRQIAAHGLGDRIILLGDRNDVSDLMQAMDLHVLPSAFGEAFPNVVAESMACGLPNVVSNVGDAAMIVGETGWVFAPGDAEGLAHCLSDGLSAMSDSQSWAQRKAACRQRIETTFSVERMVREYSKAWQEARTA